MMQKTKVLDLNRRSKKIVLLSVLCLLFLLSPIIQYSFNEGNKSQGNQIGIPNNDISDPLSSPASPDPLSLDETLEFKNVSQFNVTENARYKAEERELDLDNNFMMNIPTGWATSSFIFDIASIYEPLEYFDFYARNGDWQNTQVWNQLSNYRVTSEDPQQTYAYFGYDGVTKYGWINYHGIDTTLPLDFNGYYQNQEIGFNHDDPTKPIQLGDVFEEETTELPIEDEFEDDPEYQLIDELYGGWKGYSSVYGSWMSGLDALTTGIDVTDGWFKGEPSVGWQTYFYLPFEADSVAITLSWSIDNFGYESSDEFAVKARINENYINGEYDIDNNYYADAASDALEYDDTDPSVVSHDYWTRTYNITNMVGNYGYRTGWHSLDFGCYMRSPNNGNDDVVVNWDSVIINATHYDWYNAAELDFDYFMSDLSGQGQDKQENLTMVVYCGGSNDPSQMMRYVINETCDLKYTTDYAARETVSITLPQQYKSAFEVQDFYFLVGLERAARYNEQQRNPSVDFYQRLSIDNFFLDLNYIIGSADEEDLQARYRPTGGYQRFYSHNYFEPATSDLPETGTIELQFDITADNPYIKYSVYLNVSKYSLNSAEATANIESYSDSDAVWMIDFNNTDSVDALEEDPYNTNDYDGYNITIENLPAFDGNELNSKDWQIIDINPPTDNTGMSAAYIISSDVSYKQNITIPDAVLNVNDYERGVWSIEAQQDNYVLNSSLRHEDYSSPDKYYHLERANYTHEVRNSAGVTGNFNITMYNASGITSDFSRKFTQNYDSDNNNTNGWIVSDEGVGQYNLVTLWNDTNGDNQTTRLGWYKDTFEMWRKTIYQIKSDIDGEETPSGIPATYTLEFNLTFGENRGIKAATISAFNNDTENLWGTDWGFSWNEFHTKTDYNNGTYDIDLKTTGIEIKNYNISFLLTKSYYDPVNTTNKLWLNLTGALSDFDIEILNGAINDSGDLYLESDNIPYVNDSGSSIIQFNVTEGGVSEDPIRDMIISGSFVGFENTFYAYEQYAYSFLENDKGVYNLTIDTTDLHATQQPGYENNYTLKIWFSKVGYAPISADAEIKVNQNPLYIDVEAIDDVYESGSISIESALYQNKSGILESYSSATLKWTLLNGTGHDVLYGDMSKGLANIYTDSIDLMGIKAGDYCIIINATGLDIETTYSEEINFTIFAKYETKISFNVPENVRIGGYVSIAAKLTYINDTAIPNKNLILTINYSATYQYQVIVKTNEDGKGVYEFSIPFYYEGEDLTIYAEFAGEDLILGSENTIEKEILGKIGADIDFVDTPDYVQVGYNATFKMQLAIEEDESVEAKLIYILAFYDQYNPDDQPFLIRELSTDQDGIAEYTIDEIEDGHDNITIKFEFLGNSRIEYVTNDTLVNIYPKWLSNWNITSMPDQIRLGQTLNINFSIYSPNVTFTESFAGVPVTVKFIYDSFTQTYTHHTNANSSIYFDYNIPNSGVSTLTLNISYAGSSRIQSNISQIFVDQSILPKLTTQISINTYSGGQLLQGEYFYAFTLRDENLDPLSGIEVALNIYDQSDNLISDEPYTGVTNEKGFVSISIDFTNIEPGEYIVIAEFNGEGIFAESSSEEISVEITTHFLIFVDYLPFILGVIGVIVAISLIVFRAVVVPRRRRRREALKMIHQRLTDAENIMYILILNKKGVNIFEHSFTNVPIDGTLVSGFLSAITTFGDEIGKGIEDKATNKGLEQLSYRQFKIIVSDAAIVRVALLLMKDASDDLKQKLQKFTLRFQERFMDKLSKAKGSTLSDGPVLEIIENNLDVDLLYPHNINMGLIDSYLKELNKNDAEFKILEAAQSDQFKNTFYIREMLNYLSEIQIREIEGFNAIEQLRHEHAVFAINPRTRNLIEQFKPIIDRLPEGGRDILMQIMKGITDQTKLRKSLKIKAKGKENLEFLDTIVVLQEMGLIDKDNNLTEMGEGVATILKLMEEF
ncbi:MAG: hypothetical protein GF364_02225 [Candidatus Lokiarchaeota archaeon]|nr:hypothetical protein [Candidatus Lokiarchaeota archaeon]